MNFLENVLVSIEMLIISVMGGTNISRQFFSTLVRMGSRSHDFDDGLKISFFNFIFCRTLKRVHFGSNFFFFCTDGILCTLSGNLERIIAILSTNI